MARSGDLGGGPLRATDGGFLGWWLLLPTVLALYFTLDRLGSSSYVDGDECVYVLVARDILRWGHWLLPTLDGDAFLAKPPLFLWLIALGNLLVGPSTLGSRLLFALCGVGVVVLTTLLAARATRSRAVGVVAGTLLAVNPQFLFLHCARRAEPDVVFLFAFLAAAFLFLEALEGKKGRLVLCLVAIGLAGLFKTAAVMVFPVLFCGAALLVSGREGWRRLRRSELVPGIMLFLVVLLPWHLLAWIRYGDGFLQSYLGEQTTARLSTGEPAGSSALRYLWLGLASFHPVQIFLLPAVLLALRGEGRSRTAARVSLLFVLLCLVVVLPVRPTRNWYLLPAYPFLCLLLSMGLVSVFRAGVRHSSLALLALGAVSALVLRSDPAFDPFARLSELAAGDLRLVLESPGTGLLLVAGVGLVAGALGLFLGRRGSKLSALPLLLVGLVLGRALFTPLETLTRATSQSEIERSIAAAISGAPEVTVNHGGRLQPRLDVRIYLDPYERNAERWLERSCDPGPDWMPGPYAPGTIAVMPATDLAPVRPKLLDDLASQMTLMAVESLPVGYSPGEVVPHLFIHLGHDLIPRPPPLEGHPFCRVLDPDDATAAEDLLAAARDLLSEYRGATESAERTTLATSLEDHLLALWMLDDASILPPLLDWIASGDMGPQRRTSLVSLAAFLGDEGSRAQLLSGIAGLAGSKERVSLEILRAVGRRDLPALLPLLASIERPQEETASRLYATVGKRDLLAHATTVFPGSDTELSSLLLAILSRPDGREVYLQPSEKESCIAALDRLLLAATDETTRDAVRRALVSHRYAIWRTW